MIAGVGVDICSVDRMAAMIARHPGIVARLFTPAESDGRTTEQLAARFAAKEALAKALGAPAGLGWHEVKVMTGDDGAPTMVLSGGVAARAAQLRIGRVHLSMSHDGGLATAFVVCEEHQ